MKLQRLLAVLALCLLAAMPAHAKRGIGIINTGDELFEVGDFPPDMVSSGRNMKAGYKCSHLGFFWADIWTWDCKLVAVTGEHSYADLPPDIASELAGNPQYRFSQAKRGFWNHYAFWTLIGGFALLALLGKMRSGSSAGSGRLST